MATGKLPMPTLTSVDRSRSLETMRTLVVATVALGTLALVAASRRGVRGRKRSPKATPSMHAQAKADAFEAFQDVVHVAPTVNELRILEAVALHETTFGKGWRPPGNTSNNMGALQADASWTGETFDYSDTHPTDTGGAVPYAQKFRAYANALEGWKDLVRELYVRRSSVRRAAQSGNALDVASAMRATKYYEGQGATQSERIRNYAQAIADSLLEIDTVGKGQA